MVMPWSCSSDRASSRKAYSKGLPVRSHSCRTASSLPCGSEPVSASRRPTTVDFPWSTCPTTTICMRDRAAGAVRDAAPAPLPDADAVLEGFFILLASESTRGSHIPFAAQLLEPVLAVLETPRPLGHVLQLAALQLDDDVVHVLRRAVDGRLAGAATEAAIAGARSLVVVERNGRDALALDVLPDVHLGPVEQRVDTDVRAGREVGLELVPELGRLVAHVPGVVLVARREVALLRAAALLVGARSHDHAVVGLAVGIHFVLSGGEVQALARPRTL